jgi:hypothetical protein
METWKEIQGYEGKYKISSHGQVWSKTKGIMNLKPSSLGYVQVSLWKKNNRINTSVHRLVAITFLSNPDNLPLVDHINNVRNDNNVNNLRWTDYVGNSLNMKRNTEYSVQDFILYSDEEIQNEIWVDATKFVDELQSKDFFMVSNLGRYKYFKKNNRWGTKSVQIKSPKISLSYPKITIRVGDVKYSFSIHKLVALCFIGRPKNGEVIDHIDSNVNNPRLSNLQIITIQQNNKKANKKNDSGVNNGMSKHSVHEIRNVFHEYFVNLKSKSCISRKFNMAKATVTRIVSGETYTSLYNEFINTHQNLPSRPPQSHFQSLARKGVTQKKVTCPHCDFLGGITNMYRYHFNKCKSIQ